MRKEIQYRDLPGGPLMVKFADELPLCALCSKCGMLSKDMFEDPSSHAFCSICIFECSDRKKIHCKYENKDVSVEEMMPAIDIINVVMDQVVFCPNTSDGNSCTKYCALKDLERHYLQCEKTEIICLSCGDTVRGRDWQTHVTSCPQQIMQCRYCVVAVPRFRLELHERLCSYNPNAVREADTSPTAAMNFTSQWRSDWARNEQQLPVSVNTNKPHLIPEPKPSDFSKVDDDARLSCPICNRNVKSRNMDRHISVCLQRTNGPSSPEARQTPEIAPVLPTRAAAAIRAPVQEYPQHESQERVLPALPILHPTLEGHPNEHALPTREHVAPRASMQPDFNFQRQMFAQPASPIPHIAPGERRPGILGDCNGVRQGGGNVQMAVHDNLENKSSQSEATATVRPERGFAAIRAPVQEYPQHQSQERVLPAFYRPNALAGQPNEHALTPQDFGSALVRPDPNLERQKFEQRGSSVEQFTPRGQLHDQYALPTQDYVAVRESSQPDFNFQHQQFAQPASPISHIAPGERWPGIEGHSNGVRQGDGNLQRATPENLENKPSRSEETTAEVAAMESDVGYPLSSFECLSASDVPTNYDASERGHYSGVRQEGGYSQVAESDIVQKQPSRSEEAPTEAPGSWFGILNFSGLVRYLGTRQEGGCSETATGYIAGTQSSSSEETSGHGSEVGEEAGCSQMAASESVQPQPSRSEETPVLHDVRQEMPLSPESAEPNEKNASLVEARTDAFSTTEETRKSWFCFSPFTK